MRRFPPAILMIRYVYFHPDGRNLCQYCLCREEVEVDSATLDDLPCWVCPKCSRVYSDSGETRYVLVEKRNSNSSRRENFTDS